MIDERAIEDVKTSRHEVRRIVEGAASCPPNHHCTLKEILIHRNMDGRTVLQIQCMEKFKYERSAQAGRDIGWGVTVQQWIKEGWAASFARHYRADLPFPDIYHHIMSRGGSER